MGWNNLIFRHCIHCAGSCKGCSCLKSSSLGPKAYRYCTGLTMVVMCSR